MITCQTDYHNWIVMAKRALMSARASGKVDERRYQELLGEIKEYEAGILPWQRLDYSPTRQKPAKRAWRLGFAKQAVKTVIWDIKLDGLGRPPWFPVLIIGPVIVGGELVERVPLASFDELFARELKSGMRVKVSAIKGGLKLEAV